MSGKREKGQYYTKGNPFVLSQFKRWGKQAGILHSTILEPFAGANDIISSLQSLGQCDNYKAFDIAPSNKNVKKRDTIASFPKGFDVCVTNPPWLARNSATRRRLFYPETRHDDLYKHCLELCLNNCEYTAAIIPASYLQSGLFRDKLSSYTLLHQTMFEDTDNPVCLALFKPRNNGRISLYHDDEYIGTLREMVSRLPKDKRDRCVRFNDPKGKLGFISFDNTKKPSIRFCHADEISEYEVKVSSRFITRISGDFSDVSKMIKRLNRGIKTFRDDTRDVFLTPFKGIRDDGQYRRRMEFALARRFINAC